MKQIGTNFVRLDFFYFYFKTLFYLEILLNISIKFANDCNII